MNRRFFLLFSATIVGAECLLGNPVIFSGHASHYALAQEDFKHYFNLGMKYTKENKLQDAIEAFRKAIKLKPNEPKPYYNLGLVYQKLGYLDEAIAEFDRAEQISLNKDPSLREKLTISPKTQFQSSHRETTLAVTHQKQLHRDEKGEASVSIVTHKPDYTNGHKAIKSSRPDRLIATGYGLYLQGRMSEAINYYKKALNLDPQNSTAHFELGMVYQESSNFEDAKKHY